MAAVHRLTNTAADANKTADFLSGTFKSLIGSWQISNSGAGTAVASMTLVGKSTDANLIAAVQVIDELSEQNRLFWEAASYRDPVWYEYSANAESAAKRALVKDILLVPAIKSKITPVLGYNAVYFDLAITFMDIFEDRGGTAVVGLTAVSTLGGTVTIGALSGSWPARIGVFQFTRGPAANPLYKCWAGIKPTGAGVSSFQPVWELENGTNGTDTATYTDYNAGDATISGGPATTNNTKRCTFATATMAKRVSMTVDDACADNNYNHFAGRFNVLLRCRLSAAGECTVLMKSGYGTVLAPAEYQTVNWTVYKYVSLGEVLIPPMGNYADTWVDSAVFRSFTISVWAEQNSGTPNLHMDCLVLIPADHFTYNVGSSVADGGGYTNHYVFVDGKHIALSLDSSGNPNAGLKAGFRKWEVPILGGLLVVAGERSDAQVRGDNVTVYLSAFHRHRNFND